MSSVLQLSLLVLTIVGLNNVEAKSVASTTTSLSSDGTHSNPAAEAETIQSYSPEVLVFLELLKDGSPAVSSSDPSVFVYVHPEEHREKEPNIVDPNILLMMENFQSSHHQWSAASVPRLTRDMSSDDDPPYLETGTSRGSFYDLWFVPRRSTQWPAEPSLASPSTALVPPPLQVTLTTAKQQTAESSVPRSGNKVTGRSISPAHMSPNHSDASDDESPDFLSTLVTIPQVWMHDLSHMIIQPLRKPTSGERDSYEYFGMVGKAPFIQCPLGFKKSSLGTCRPVFRSRRNYPMSSAQEPEIESKTTMEAISVTEEYLATTSASI